MRAGFLDALKTFEKAGSVHWTTRHSDALRDMAEQYAADLVALPWSMGIGQLH